MALDYIEDQQQRLAAAQQEVRRGAEAADSKERAARRAIE